MSTLGYDLEKFGSEETFARLVGEVDMYAGSELELGPLLLAAVALEVYADDLLDYVSPPDPYLAAATAVEMDAQEAEWGAFVRKRRLVDKIAEIIELMILEQHPQPAEETGS